MDLQTIQHLRSIRTRELETIQRKIDVLESERQRVLQQIVDLLNMERRRTNQTLYEIPAGVKINLGAGMVPFGNDGAA